MAAQDHERSAFAELVRSRRLARGLSQEEVSERVGMSQEWTSMVERGRIKQPRIGIRAEARPPRAPRKFTTELIIDGTGVGLPVVDLIRERGIWATVALFTGTDKLTEHPGNTITIGKGYMVSRLQALLQSRRLHLPVSDEAIALTKELQNYEINVSDRGHASFNARSGKHDDLVIALGLSAGMEHHAAPATSRSYLHSDPNREREAPQRSRWSPPKP